MNDNVNQTKANTDIDPVIEAYKKDVDRTLIRENLRLTVDERFQQLIEIAALCRRTATCRERNRIPTGTDFQALIRLLTERKVTGGGNYEALLTDTIKLGPFTIHSETSNG